MTYERGEVVVVPFPFTDKQANRRRPALIVSSDGAFGSGAGHSVLAMITSATASDWPLDTPLADLATAGLKRQCRVRMKLFTLDHRLIIRRAGCLSNADLAAVDAALDRLFDR